VAKMLQAHFTQSGW